MTGSDFYSWQTPGFTARITFDVIDRLRTQSAQLRRVSHEEQGGILYGAVSEDGIPQITNFEFFKSEHRRGISYDLGAAERQRLGRRVINHMNRRRDVPVGYFRTHHRPGLFLDQDDFHVMNQSFRFPSAVALLIRPEADGRQTAGFFFWEDGDMDRRQSQLAFPFIADPDWVVARAAAAQKNPRTPMAIAMPSAKWAVAALAIPAVAGVLALANHHRTAPAPTHAETALAVVQAVPQAKPSPVEAPIQAAARDPETTEVASAPRNPPPVVQMAPPAIYQETASLLRPQPIARVQPAPLTKPDSMPRMQPVPNPDPIMSVPPASPPVMASNPEPQNRPAPLLRPRTVHSVVVGVSVDSRQPQRISNRLSLRRVVGRVPLVGRTFQVQDEEFIPARPERALAPHVPARMIEELVGAGEVPVDVRVNIDRTGTVRSAEILNGGGSSFAFLAADTLTASPWSPARLGDREVPSEVIVHYRFKQASAERQ